MQNKKPFWRVRGAYLHTMRTKPTKKSRAFNECKKMRKYNKTMPRATARFWSFINHY